MKHSKHRDRIRFLAIAGVLLALILIFILVPINVTGLVSVGVIAIIAVIIGCQSEGFLMGLFCGVAFGVASLISSFTTGAGALLAPAFHNPLISIFPRIIMPVTTYFAYVGMRELILLIYSKKKNTFDEKKANHLSIVVSSTVSAIVGVVTNTALVMGMLFAFHQGQMFGNTLIGTAMLVGILSTNFPIELAICAAVTPAVIIALKSAFHTKVDIYSPKNKSTKQETDSTIQDTTAEQNTENEQESTVQITISEQE